MGRKILAVIVGLLTAWGFILIVGIISTRMWSTPNNLEYMSRSEVVAYVASRPIESFIVVLIGYVIGAYFGGFIVTKMSRRESPGISLPILIGGLLTVGAIINFAFFPGQPLWFMALSLLTFIPLSLLGHRFAR